MSTDTPETTEQKSIVDALLRVLHEVSFVQLVRCIQYERLERIGHQKEISNQPVRFVAEIASGFPSSELTQWEPANERSVRPQLETAFFGLFGPSGALPEHYTRFIEERVREKDFGLAEFLNVFNHRLLTLFYSAWEKHSMAASMEISEKTGTSTVPVDVLSAIAGNRLNSGKDRQSFEDHWLLYFAGHFANRRPTQEALRAVIEEFTDCITTVEPLVGEWLLLEPDEQSSMEVSGMMHGVSTGNRLGIDTIVGDRVWEAEHRFRISIGPVDWAVFDSFLPSRAKLRQVCDLVRRLVGPEWEFDIQILVNPKTLLETRLDPNEPFFLGYNCWLGEPAHQEPLRDAVFELPDIETCTF